jgi:acetolactate synthase-1/2/3 large subunit
MINNMIIKNKKTGAEIFVDTIIDLGLEYIFGHTGGAIMPMYVELNKRIKRKEKVPEVIMFRQEPGAGHAAEGYAKLTGKPVLVCTTSGPGATNLVTPIADAYADSVPVIFVTGQVTSNLIGTNAFQEVPIKKIIETRTKKTYLVKSPDEIKKVLYEAYEIALTGRPGPVLIDICKDAFTKEILKEDYNPQYHLKNIDKSLDRTKVDKILLEFSKANKPLIYVGGGVKISNSHELLKEFAKKYNAPIGMTFMALGTVPRDDNLSLGMLGMHGTVEANFAALNSDFILAIGARFDDRVAVKDFGINAKIAHIDIDNNEINRLKKVDYAINSDAKIFLEYALKYGPEILNDLSEWHKNISEWKKQNPKLEESNIEIIPQKFIKELSDITSGNAIITTGVGQHQMWTAQYYNFISPYDLLTSGGLGTMGFGLPAAIGAYFASQKKEIILIDGDGSFQMNIQELGTIDAHNIPIKMIVLNNGFWGLPMQWHKMFDEGHLFECCLDRTKNCPKECSEFNNCRNHNPDLLGLSKVYHKIKTKRISKPEEVIPAIKEILDHNGPYILEVEIKRDSLILPIIPPGKGIKDMIY